MKYLSLKYCYYIKCVYIQKRKKLGRLFVWVCSGNKRLVFSKLTTLPGGLSSVNIDFQKLLVLLVMPISNFELPFKITKFQ